MILLNILYIYFFISFILTLIILNKTQDKKFNEECGVTQEIEDINGDWKLSLKFVILLILFSPISFIYGGIARILKG